MGPLRVLWPASTFGLVALAEESIVAEPAPKKDPKEPILRGEYELRHEALRQEYEAFAKKSTRILRVLLVVTLATAALSGYLLRENTRRVEDINSSLVQACEQNGNPLRWVVRQFGFVLIGQIEKNVEQSKTLEKAGTFEEIFPSYPSDKLHALLVKSREEERQDKEGLQSAISLASPVACEERYPPK